MTRLALCCSFFFGTLPLLFTSALGAEEQILEILAEEAKAYWRFVGVKTRPEDPCPAPCPEGQDKDKACPWKPEPFPVLTARLEAFCVYRSESRKVTPDDVKDLLGLIGASFDRLDPDRLAVRPAAAGLQDDLWPALERHFALQTGDVELEPVADLMPTRLALIDTAPDGQPCGDDHTSAHGTSLCHMAKSLLCRSPSEEPLGACVAEVTSRLALAYTAFDPNNPVPEPAARDEIRGGHVGTLTDLAMAILREVEALTQSAARPNLVLALALGWDGELFGGLTQKTPEMMPPDVELVYRALEAAACEGVLAVAASGNRADELGKSGLLLPAGWEQRPVPAACARFDGEPLVYAVGAVDSAGEILANALPESLPPRVAYGDHAVVARFDTQQPTATLTGTSVASLVVAASAAALWHYLPSWSAAEIMEHLHLRGEPLPGGPVPDVCFDQNPLDPCKPSGLDVRRVSLCHAVCSVTGVCPGGTAACPVAPSAVTGLPASLTSFPSSPMPIVPLTKMPGSEPPGNAAAPWVHPQPGNEPCRNCLMRPNSGSMATYGTDRPWLDKSGAVSTKMTSWIFYLEVEPNFPGELFVPTLYVCGSAYELPVSTPIIGGFQEAYDVPLPIGTCPVRLVFDAVRDNVRSSTLTPVLRVP